MDDKNAVSDIPIQSDDKTPPYVLVPSCEEGYVSDLFICESGELSSDMSMFFSDMIRCKNVVTRVNAYVFFSTYIGAGKMLDKLADQSISVEEDMDSYAEKFSNGMMGWTTERLRDLVVEAEGQWRVINLDMYEKWQLKTNFAPVRIIFAHGWC